MEFTNFVRKPFVVEAVEITKDNISELAPFIGELKEKEDGSPYIEVNSFLIPNLERVFPGFWFTRMGDETRCYTRKIFRKQFTVVTPQIQALVDAVVLRRTNPSPPVSAQASGFVSHEDAQPTFNEPEEIDACS